MLKSSKSIQPIEGTLTANGIRIHYLEWGSADHPPAVLLHANGFLARLWQPIAERLCDSFHVYAWDARGHGDSDKPSADYHWQHFVDDFRAFLDHLGLRRVLAIGHSSGGCVAANLAATQPDYVSGLGLIEPVILPPEIGNNSEGSESASGARRRRMVWSSTEEIFDSYRRRAIFANWQEDVLRLYAEQGTFRRSDGLFELKCPGEIEAQVFENHASINTYELLPQIRCPTLLLRGANSKGLPAECTIAAAGRVPNARLVEIEGAGHLAVMERPEIVATLLLDFVRSAGIGNAGGAATVPG